MPSAGAETAERAEATGTETSWDKHKDTFLQKRTSKYHDPCQDLANKSIRCMNRNNGDKEMCSDFFQAYRDCKKEWTDAMRGVDSTKKGWWAQRWNS